MHLVARHHGNGRQSWVRPIPDPVDAAYGIVPTLTIGRTRGDWNVPWDDQVSRQHVQIHCVGEGKIRVTRLPAATNPVFHAGAATDDLTIGIGESFVIGQTRFECIEAPTMQADASVLRTIDPANGSDRWTDDAIGDDAVAETVGVEVGLDDDASPSLSHRQLRSLGRLPKLLQSSLSLDEAISRVIEMVRPLIPGVDQIAVASVPVDPSRPPVVISGDGLDEPDGGDDDLQTFAPDLLRRAASEERLILRRDRGSAVDRFAGADDRGGGRWIAAVPIGTIRRRQWVWWIAGRRFGGRSSSWSADIAATMQYVSVVSQMARQWYRDRAATRRQSTMSRFFSPTVLASLTDDSGCGGVSPDLDDDSLRGLLKPRTAELTALFFDLTGFTDWTNAAAAGGDLSGLMDTLHRSMSIVTGHILAAGGVVGDFHGDAVMGFWGWPIDPPSPSAPIDAAIAAALAITRSLRQHPITTAGGSSLRGGIGIATGTAVAGGIGSDDQLKITAIGPAINLAARLQSETRRLNQTIVADSNTIDRMSTELAAKVQIVNLLPLSLKGFEGAVRANVIQT